MRDGALLRVPETPCDENLASAAAAASGAGSRWAGDHSSQTEGGWIYGCGDEICPRPLTHFDSISLADEWMDGSELLLSRSTMHFPGIVALLSQILNPWNA